MENRIDIAMAINADGVHLDYNDMSILDVKNLNLKLDDLSYRDIKVYMNNFLKIS